MILCSIDLRWQIPLASLAEGSGAIARMDVVAMPRRWLIILLSQFFDIEIDFIS